MVAFAAWREATRLADKATAKRRFAVKGRRGL